MASITNNLMESDDDYIPPVKLKKTTNDVRMKIKLKKKKSSFF
jgi:hypothetical protein